MQVYKSHRVQRKSKFAPKYFCALLLVILQTFSNTTQSSATNYESKKRLNYNQKKCKTTIFTAVITLSPSPTTMYKKISGDTAILGLLKINNFFVLLQPHCTFSPRGVSTIISNSTEMCVITFCNYVPHECDSIQFHLTLNIN